MWTFLGALVVASIATASVVCPDGISSCPDQATCCKTAGSYGCCPMPNAVCCSNNINCCPEGFTCNLVAGTCEKKYVKIPLISKLPMPEKDELTSASLMKESVVHCDSTHYCLDNTTCCKLISGAWGCCPYPNAVCCRDHRHCCPQNSWCFFSTQCFLKDNTSIPMLAKTPALPFVEELSVISENRSSVNYCDKLGYCPNNNTCCKRPNGRWGCCPSQTPVCCSDGYHCCPASYRCDSSSTQCYRSSDGNIIESYEKTPALLNTEASSAISDSLSSVVYCDNLYYCPDGTRCCRRPSGGWGCCPSQAPVCCRDGYHCCPAGYGCDSSSTHCYRSSDGNIIESYEKTPALINTEASTAISDSRSSIVYCDNLHYCPDGTRCCRRPSGGWGCCPSQAPVCCRDGYHCCPAGYRCDSSSTQCYRSSDGSIIESYEKTPALISTEASSAIDDSPSSIVYCDNLYYCPDGTSCCRRPSGGWGCCPSRAPVCCRDGYHCCPAGYRCDISSTRCYRSSDGNIIESYEKTPALLNTEASSAISDSRSSVVYCDNLYYCPDGTRCCRRPSGGWGCCPSQAPVCCRDGYHCCRAGYRCDITSTRCYRSSDGNIIESYEKTPALLNTEASSAISDSRSSIVYCDNLYYCPDGTRCCRRPSGGWGCCPSQAPVCCRDGYHCCPAGYRCDISSTRCYRSSDGNIIESYEKTPALINTEASPAISDSRSSIVYCDNLYYCPDGTRCCRRPSGGWGCCPSQAPVCCRDGYHCCPSGYRCDSTSTRCTRPFDGDVILSSEKTPALVSTEASSALSISRGSVVYCDNIHYCADGYTCCRQLSGLWGCCPLVQASCCPDGIHCCPHGYVCTSTSTGCVHPYGDIIPSVEKLPALVDAELSPSISEDQSSVMHCDDQHYCSKGTTCCRHSNGEWDCCSLEN
ncbi:progranulin-like isoform X2 [Protopterus annectens]|uniref:progranulin-like isoform X2 n=1 Tax=Protopterus annectens TaxID=7888 RepID=UPI001CFB8C52|nr:progranulin-like isoform X2 [Protopterus annectens]